MQSEQTKEKSKSNQYIVLILFFAFKPAANLTGTLAQVREVYSESCDQRITKQLLMIINVTRRLKHSD